MTALRVLAVGDVVGRPGRRVVRENLVRLRDELALDFIVVNGENAANNGSGCGISHARELLQLRADVVTLGDHWFRKGDLFELMADEPRVLRPANYPEAAVGAGFGRFSCGERSIGVVVVQGRVFMEPVDCPFAAVDGALAELADCDLLLVEVHAEATSEKMAVARHLDGRVAAVWGTHTHVQTADGRRLPGGTGFISDLGMSGPHDGVIGRRTEPVLKKMRTGMPAPFHVATGDVRLHGAVFVIDPVTRTTTDVEPLVVISEPAAAQE